MDRLDAMRLFRRTAELGSFSAAARESKLAQSQVSRAVKALESSFGATLLNRSTRSVSLTAEGERALRHMRDALDAIDLAREAICTNEPVGLLRVAAPVGYGQAVVAPVLRRYLARFPTAEAALDLSDEFVNLAVSGHDVAVRIGTVDGQALRVVSLGACPMRLVAAPDHAAASSSLRRPDDLAAVSCLAYASWRVPTRWILKRGSERHTVQVNGRLSSTHLPTLRNAVLEGLGVANLPAWLTDDDLEAGRLVQVLPGWRAADQPIQAVLPPGRYTPQRSRLFLDLLKAELARD
ncbi:MAG: LysR family transcriptional regulator [Geminicoccaceae bacterium]